MAQRDARPPFAAIGGTVPPEFAALPTPCYLLDEAALTRNAEILGGLARRTGCKVLLAQKAFSNYDLYPLLAPHLAGTEASGLFEARLGAVDAAFQRCHIVAGPRNVVPAAEIQPLHCGQQVAKFIGYCVQRHGQCVGIQLTQGVEVQAVQQHGQSRVSRHGSIPLCAGRAQAAAGGAGVVDRVAVLC